METPLFPSFEELNIFLVTSLIKFFLSSSIYLAPRFVSITAIAIFLKQSSSSTISIPAISSSFQYERAVSSNSCFMISILFSTDKFSNCTRVTRFINDLSWLTKFVVPSSISTSIGLSPLIASMLSLEVKIKVILLQSIFCCLTSISPLSIAVLNISSSPSHHILSYSSITTTPLGFDAIYCTKLVASPFEFSFL